MAYADPFSFLFGTLWERLELSAEFCALVKEANRIKLDTSFKPIKETLMESSVPEVMLLPAGKRMFEENPCSGRSIIQVVHVTIVSGLRNTARVFATEWAVIQAIHDAFFNETDSILTEEWESEKIIKEMNSLPMEEGLTYDDELNRTLKGWSAIWPIEFKLFVSNTLLTPTEVT